MCLRISKLTSDPCIRQEVKNAQGKGVLAPSKMCLLLIGNPAVESEGNAGQGARKRDVRACVRARAEERELGGAEAAAT